ncbi:MAG TPA: MoaD/ThiS family protein [Candidatus Acetothermia bacterium]|nr:MoaD/ThiS family protein [Candidatus Acetothermia bacterium]
MTVKVRLYFPFRRELGAEELSLTLPEGADVAAAIQELVRRYPLLRERLYDPQGRLQRFVSALVNGTQAQFLQGLATKLQDGDQLVFLPPVGGG